MCLCVRLCVRVCALLTYLVNALAHCCLGRRVVVGDWMIVNIHLIIITSVRCRWMELADYTNCFHDYSCWCERSSVDHGIQFTKS